MIEVKVLLGLCCWCWVLGLSFSHDLHSQALPSLSPALTSRLSSPSSFSPSRRPSRLPTAAPSIGVFPPTAQYSALNDLYEETAGWQWTWSDQEPGVPWNFSQPADAASTGPMSMSNPCAANWQGVKCSVCSSSADCVVLELNLPSHNLTGSLPMSLGNLSSLESLDLHGNELQGSIPESLGLLKSLKVLSLGHNQHLRGSIPDIFYNITNLVTLNLGHNVLHGRIPPSIYHLKDLSTLLLESNYLIGTISDEISVFRKLLFLDVNSNNFTGTFPSTISKLSYLLSLEISNNFFSGTIHSGIGNLLQLRYLGIASNKLTGSIPTSFNQLLYLRRINLQENQLYGSLPSQWMYLPDIQVICVSDNFFTGAFPDPLPAWKGLNSLVFHNNLFYGPASSFFLFPNVFILSLSFNYFSGSVHNVTSPEILYFRMSENLFTGPLPYINTTYLNTYRIDRNYFTGQLFNLSTEFTFNSTRFHTIYQLVMETANLPGEIYNDLYEGFQNYNGDIRSLLYYLNCSTNLITGTMPSWVVNAPAMTYSYASFNYFTGKLPEVVNNNSLMLNLYVAHNVLTGTIPSSYHNLTKLVALEVNNNYLTGSFPRSLLVNTSLYSLFVQYNKLTGRLPLITDAGNIKKLQILELSNNLFTGSIPANYFLKIPMLSFFSAGSNCLTGSLPRDICNSTSLTGLSLDGMTTGSACRHNIFENIGTFNSFTLLNYIEGGIPNCFFSMQSLRTLHLSGNAFSGTIPDNLNISKSLVSLTLSHNRLYGTIPIIMQQHPWQTLDLSFNRFTGELQKDLQVATSLSLSITDGGTDSIGHVIHPSGGTINGSATIYLDVNRLSGKIPKILHSLQDVVILNGNIFSCRYWNYAHEELPQHDPKVDSYSCGSNSVDQAFFLWLVVFACLLLATICFYRSYEKMKANWEVWKDKILTWQLATTSSPYFEIRRFGIFCEHIRKVSLSLTCILVLFYIPFYAVLSKYYGVYQYEYTWSISAVYKSGVAVGVLITLLFIAAITGCYWLFRHQLKKKWDQLLINKDEEDVMQSSKRSSRMSSSDVTSDVSTSFRLQLLIYIAVFLVNISVTIITNVAYVIAVISVEESYNLGMIRVLFAIFKLTWNDVWLWMLLLKIKAEVMKRYHTAHKDGDQSGLYSISKDEIFLMIVCTLFNNIIAPSLSIAIINPQCFYNAFIAASSLESTIIYCSLYLRVGKNGFFCNREDYISTSYDPPFIYNYNCASLLPVNYVEIFIYMMFMVAVVLPMFKVCAYWTFDYLLLKQKDSYVERDQANRQSYILHVKAWLPRMLLPLQSEVIATDFTLFDQHRFVVRTVSILVLLFSFGVVYPPLAVLITMALVTTTYFEQLVMGRLLVQSAELFNPSYALQLSHNTKNLPEYYLQSIYPMIFVSCLLFACLLFDIFGDITGYTKAIYPTLFVLMYPLCIYFVEAYLLPLWAQPLLFMSAQPVHEHDVKVQLNETSSRLSTNAEAKNVRESIVEMSAFRTTSVVLNPLNDGQNIIS